jgi:topoisomerase (DNA) II binding protein 1
VSFKYQEAVQNTVLVIVHCTTCENILLSQIHHVSFAGSSITEEKSASSVNKRRRSETGKAKDTSSNIERTEKHVDSSSVPGVADCIEDLLVQSSRVQRFMHFTIPMTWTCVQEIE